MPEAIEPQLDELRRRARRRLVGAVVLALAAAVLVPMLLESEPRPLGEDVSVRIPPVDDGKFVSRLGEKRGAETPQPAAPAMKDAARASNTETTKPADAPDSQASSGTKPAAAEPVAAAPKPSPEPAASTPAAPKPEPAREATDTKPTASRPADKPSQAASKDAAPETTPSGAARPATDGAGKAGSGFSVQLAAFSDDKGANALANRLKKSGHPAYTEPYSSSRGTLWRVRVGPYATREAAEAARAKLKADGQNGIIAAVN